MNLVGGSIRWGCSKMLSKHTEFETCFTEKSLLNYLITIVIVLTIVILVQLPF